MGFVLARLGRADEARAELQRAAAVTRNQDEQRLLRDRGAALG